MLSSISLSLLRVVRFDTGFVRLRAATVATATVLGTYGAALLVEHFAQLRVDTVVQAVVIASGIARAQRDSDRTDRLLGCLVLPMSAAGAAELSTLIVRCPDPADVLFILGAAGSIWVRRFGPRATRAGTLAVVPLIAVLVNGQSVAPAGLARTAWSALIALIAAAWGALALWTAERTGFVAGSASREGLAAAAAATRRPGLPASTRMALQMAVALGCAFAVGRALWPDHWAWVVLTAFIVCSGARGRGDVLLKGVRRAGGAALGTLVAALAAGAFGPRSDLCVVLIFTVLALATWLRELSYAYWAGCVTAMLSLLYDWFGQSSGDLLLTRLAGIGLGALLGVASSWLVLPVRTGEVVRARTAAAVAALGELLDADWTDARALRAAQLRLGHSTEQLDLATAALRSQQRLPARWRGTSGHAGAADAVRRLAHPVAELVDAAGRSGALAGRPEVARIRAEVAANARTARKTIGRRPIGPHHPAAPGAQPADRARAALTEIDRRLAALITLFAPPPPQPPQAPPPNTAPVQPTPGTG